MRPLRRPALVVLFLLTLPAVTPRLYASDEIQYFSYLRSLWFDHDVSFDNEYRYFDARGVAARSGFRETFLEPTTPTGLRPSVATIGCALLWAPFYAVADAGVRIMRAFGSSVEADGYSWPYVAAVSYGSAVYGWLAVLLGLSLARRFVGDSTPAAVLAWFGTPLVFYMYVAPLFAHATSAFMVALVLLIWLHVRERWSPGGVAVLGAAGALMTMVREQDVLFLVPPGIDFARSVLRRGPSALGLGPALSRAGVALASFAVAFLPQALAYLAINGRLGPSEVTTRKMVWTSPHALDVLFSPQNGFVFWTPLFVLAIAGLLMLTLKSELEEGRFLAGCLLVGVALQVYVNGSIQSWTVAGAFGQRRFVSLTAILVLGLAALFDLTARRVLLRRALIFAALICVWWNVGLMVQFGAHRMDRQRLTLAQNAWTTFVELPREAPGIVWRYFADRASFYNRPRQ